MKRWGLVLVLLAAAGLASGSSSTPRPRLTLELLRSTVDSAWVKATLDSRDARGNPVHHYDAALTRAAIGDTSVFWQAQVLANVTGLGTATIAMARPLAGDTVRLWLDASATDSRGSTSGFARSATLVIITPWSPPAPPTITIDTLLATGTPDPSRYPWNYDSLTAYLMGGIRVGNADQGEQPVEFTYLTQTVEVCYLAWYGSNAEVPRFRVQGSTNDPETLRVETIPQRSDCVAVTALKPTQLGFSGDARAYQRALP